MFENFSTGAKTAIDNAIEAAAARQDSPVRATDLLAGILHLPKEELRQLPDEVQVDVERDRIPHVPLDESEQSSGGGSFSSVLRSALEFADWAARQSRAKEVGPEPQGSRPLLNRLTDPPWRTAAAGRAE